MSILLKRFTSNAGANIVGGFGTAIYNLVLPSLVVHKLSPDDFSFAPDGTTQLKLEILPQLMVKNISAKMVGDFNGCNPKLYTEKLAGGVKACLGFVKTPYSEYVPNTVLNIDIRTATRLPLQVIATYRRKRSDSVYNELVYKAKKIDWDNITFPKDYDYLSKPNM